MTAAALRRAGMLALLFAASDAVLGQQERAEQEGAPPATVDTIPVNADDEEESAAPPTTSGPKEERTAVLFVTLGLSMVSSKFDNLDDAINLDMSIGATLPWPYLDWFGGEFDLSFTVVPGDNQGPSRCETTGAVPPLQPGTTTCEAGAFTTSQNQLQMTNVALFGVLRTPGTFYGLGKFGWRYIASSVPEIQEEDPHGPAWAAGAGFRFGHGGLTGVELLYSDYSEHLEYVMLGLTHGFGSAPAVDSP